MNNEQQELLNDAYKNYCTQLIKDSFLLLRNRLPLDIFINKCKTDPEFSEKWGLKIEERELTWEESNEYYNNHQSLKVPYLGLKVPTKAITVTYNDKTIESYE